MDESSCLRNSRGENDPVKAEPSSLHVVGIVGVPFQNADLIDPKDGDIVTHLQIGQIEIQ